MCIRDSPKPQTPNPKPRNETSFVKFYFHFSFFLVFKQEDLRN
jgi:hypothetical protein